MTETKDLFYLFLILVTAAGFYYQGKKVGEEEANTVQWVSLNVGDKIMYQGLWSEVLEVKGVGSKQLLLIDFNNQWIYLNQVELVRLAENEVDSHIDEKQRFRRLLEE